MPSLRRSLRAACAAVLVLGSISSPHANASVAPLSGIATAPLTAGFHNALQGLTKIPVLLPATIDTAGMMRSSFAPVAEIELVVDQSYTVAFLQKLDAREDASHIPLYDNHLLAQVRAQPDPDAGWLTGRSFTLRGGTKAFFGKDVNGPLVSFRSGKICYAIALQKHATYSAAVATADSMTPRPTEAAAASVSGPAALRAVVPALHRAANVPVLVPARIDVTALYGVALAASIGKADRAGTYRVNFAGALPGVFDTFASLEGSAAPIPGRSVDAAGHARVASNGTNAMLDDGTKATFDQGGVCGGLCSVDTALRFRRGSAYYEISMPYDTDGDEAAAKARLLRFAKNLVVASGAP